IACLLQLERELEKAAAEMPPAQDQDEDSSDASDEYDRMVVPGQPGQPMNEQKKKAEKQKHRDALQQRMQLSPAGSGKDLTTIEIMSSGEDDSASNKGQPTADANATSSKTASLKTASSKTGSPKTTSANDSSDEDDDDDDDDDDNDGAGAFDDSDTEEEINRHYCSTTDDSDADGATEKQERLFDEILAETEKTFSQLVKLCEIAFKLMDFDRIELSLKVLQDEASVPAHIWVKYLKAYQVVTQTPEEHKQFALKCCSALSYHYNIPLAEFIVGYLEDHAEEEQNHRVLWVKLINDYDVERPDFGLKLTEKLTQMTSDAARNAYLEPLKKACATWAASAEVRETIGKVVTAFKAHLESIKIQYSDWDWAKVHTQHTQEVLSLDLNEDIKNSVIRFIFERSVSKYPTADALWLAYIKFIQGDAVGNASTPEDAAKLVSRIGKGFLLSSPIDVAKRGFRCRPTTRLNHKLLGLMELACCDLALVDEHFQAMIKRTAPNLLMSVELHLDYLAYRVRNTNGSDEDEATSLRAAFLKTWEDLSELYGDQADTSYEILQLWAQVEYTHLKSPANGTKVWRQIMGYPGCVLNGRLWANFCQMEMEYNGVGQGTRDIFREAFGQPYLTEGQVLHELYRRYERCFGTYETIAACQTINVPPDYAALTFPTQRNHRFRQNRPKEEQKDQGQAGTTDTQSRRQAFEKMVGKKPDKKEVAKKDGPLAAQGDGPVVAKTVAKPPVANLATQPDPDKPSGSDVRPSTSKYSHHLEANKVFVKNLHPATTKEELQALFAPFGNLKDVRIVFK
ncbi:hypothetical protein KR038_004089, partial [Drosophila bunnanda]